MRKRTGGIAMIAAAACITYFSDPLLNEENVEETFLKVTKNQVSEVPATLIAIIDGDTIKVRFNGKIETVRYLLIDTPESKNPKTCVQPYAKEAYLRNSLLVKSGK
jgi:micrococcal nuclease